MPGTKKARSGSSPPKVLHLINSRGLYGAERVLVNLIAATDRQHYSPQFCLLRTMSCPNQELLDIVRSKQAQPYVIPCRRWIDPAAVRQLKKLLKEKRIDIIHSHGMKARLYGLLAAPGISVHTLTTHHNWIRSSLIETCFELLDAFYIRFYPKIVAVSPEVQQHLRRFFIPQKKIQIIINGIDMQEFRRNQQSRENIRNEFGIAPETLLIGTIGRISPEKGQKYFIEAAAQVLKSYPQACFVLVGNGGQGEEMRAYAEALGIARNVIFAGFRTDIAEWYSALDMFVLPSLLEGTPMALLEAMSTGVPVVATDVGGVGHIVQNGENGILVPSANADELVAGMNKLLADSIWADQLAQNGMRTIEMRYSAQKMAEGYMSLYDELIAKNKES
ncbi:MAG: glycosyltransferase family 4 protein [Candidatus Electrothrix sp. Rat3]|nr:glycosyltransferase family 4 protein [Candidatus Electrothrix rattekaaiensis]